MLSGENAKLNDEGEKESEDGESGESIEASVGPAEFGFANEFEDANRF